MKAILIEEDRFKEICDKLKSESELLIAKETEPQRKVGISMAHRSFHFHFVSWAQSHGAKCI